MFMFIIYYLHKHKFTARKNNRTLSANYYAPYNLSLRNN